MTIIFILIGCSLVLALGFLGAFIWSVKSGQIDDTTTPAYRILDEEEGSGSKVQGTGGNSNIGSA